MKKAFLVLLVLIVLPIAALIGVNLSDEALSPEVEMALKREPMRTPNQLNAFYYAIGVEFGETEDPEAQGRKLWERRTEPGFPFLFDPKKSGWQSRFKGCGESPICTVKDIQQDPGLLEVINSNEAAIKHYIKLMEYGETAVLLPLHPELSSFYFRGLPAAVQPLFTLQLAAWIQKGGIERVLNLIELSNRFYASLFREGVIHERVMALHGMRSNALFLSAEMERNPKLKVTPTLAASFEPPDVSDMLFGSLDFELPIVLSMSRNLREMGGNDAELIGPPDSTLYKMMRHLPLTLVLRPNQMVNKYFAIASQMLASDCLDGDEAQQIACVPDAAWMYPKKPWDELINPFGKRMVATLTAGYLGRHKTLEDRVKTIQEFRSRLGH